MHINILLLFALFSMFGCNPEKPAQEASSSSSSTTGKKSAQEAETGKWGSWVSLKNCDPIKGELQEKRECLQKPCFGPSMRTVDCNRDGGWGQWVNVGECIPGQSTILQRRHCDSPFRKKQGRDCVGEKERTINCPIHGGWSPYTGTCNTFKGERRETRTCNNPAPAFGGKNCVGSSERITPCQRNGGWSDWVNHGTCVGGNQEQRRTCTNPVRLNGGAVCSGPSTRQMACSRSGGWTTWRDISTCDPTTGIKRQQRDCTNPRPSIGGQDCSGENFQSVNCQVNGGWTEYEEVPGSCNPATGFKRYVRTCTNPTPRNGGSFCEGPPTKEATCPVNGGLGAWTDTVSGCDQSTGRAQQQRLCNNPSPKNGGAACESEPTRSVNCLVNGGWSAYTTQGSCVRVGCGVGRQTYVRSCNNPVKRNGGADCVGDNTETRSCDTGTPCTLDYLMPVAFEENKFILYSQDNEFSVPADTFNSSENWLEITDTSNSCRENYAGKWEIDSILPAKGGYYRALVRGHYQKDICQNIQFKRIEKPATSMCLRVGERGSLECCAGNLVKSKITNECVPYFSDLGNIVSSRNVNYHLSISEFTLADRGFGIEANDWVYMHNSCLYDGVHRVTAKRKVGSQLKLDLNLKRFFEPCFNDTTRTAKLYKVSNPSLYLKLKCMGRFHQDSLTDTPKRTLGYHSMYSNTEKTMTNCPGAEVRIIDTSNGNSTVEKGFTNFSGFYYSYGNFTAQDLNSARYKIQVRMTARDFVLVRSFTDTLPQTDVWEAIINNTNCTDSSGTLNCGTINLNASSTSFTKNAMSELFYLLEHQFEFLRYFNIPLLVRSSTDTQDNTMNFQPLKVAVNTGFTFLETDWQGIKVDADNANHDLVMRSVFHQFGHVLAYQYFDTWNMDTTNHADRTSPEDHFMRASPTNIKEAMMEGWADTWSDVITGPALRAYPKVRGTGLNHDNPTIRSYEDQHGINIVGLLNELYFGYNKYDGVVNFRENPRGDQDVWHFTTGALSEGTYQGSVSSKELMDFETFINQILGQRRTETATATTWGGGNSLQNWIDRHLSHANGGWCSSINMCSHPHVQDFCDDMSSITLDYGRPSN